MVSTEQRPREDTRSFLKGGAGIAVAMFVTNVANYLYTVLAAHVIGRESFGAFSALLAVLLVVGVLSLGLQATGARRIAADPGSVEEVERVVLGVGLRSAVVLGVVCLALTPAFSYLLHLDSLAAAAMVGVTAAPFTFMGAQAGVLQGERRWLPLSMVYLFQGVGRFLIGVPLMLIWPGELSAMIGVALGAWLPVLAGYLALRRPRSTSQLAQAHPNLDLLREVGHSSQALLAFFALSNADILMARATLDHSDAGLYASGLILVKAVLFLPQFVVVVAFPSMSTNGASRRTLVLAVATSAALGLAAVAGVLVLPSLAQVFVGGSQFAAIGDDLWKFAIIGTLLSINQLLVYSALARQQRKAVAMIWTTLALLVVGAALVIDSVFALVNLVIALDLILFVALFVTSMARRPAPIEAADEALVHQD